MSDFNNVLLMAGLTVDQHAYTAENNDSHQLSQETCKNALTSHSKQLHNLPQSGEREYRDLEGQKKILLCNF